MKRLILLGALVLAVFPVSQAEYFKVTKHAYFDIDIDGQDSGRIVIGLFGEEVPMTVNNFVTLATQGVRGYKYQGTKFHRIIKSFMIQGGDVVSGDGLGSISVYGDTFPDESFRIKHATAGFLSMANSGKDTNGCQFFFTLVPTSWLDGRHVVFGKVVEGMDVVETMAASVVDYQDKPHKDISIRKSGLLPLDEPYELSDNPNDFWLWMKAISLPLGMSLTIIGFLQYLAYQIPSY